MGMMMGMGMSRGKGKRGGVGQEAIFGTTFSYMDPFTAERETKTKTNKGTERLLAHLVKDGRRRRYRLLVDLLIGGYGGFGLALAGWFLFLRVRLDFRRTAKLPLQDLPAGEGGEGERMEPPPQKHKNKKYYE